MLRSIIHLDVSPDNPTKRAGEGRGPRFWVPLSHGEHQIPPPSPIHSPVISAYSAQFPKVPERSESIPRTFRERSLLTSPPDLVSRPPGRQARHNRLWIMSVELYAHQDPARYYREDHLEQALRGRGAASDALRRFLDALQRSEAAEALGPENLFGLNLGCGRGTSCNRLPGRCMGIDFNPALEPLWVQNCVLATVATVPEIFWEEEPDYTVSFDFLEHVDPDEAEMIVQELLWIDWGWHLIDLRPQSGFRGPGGENLHPAARLPWGKFFLERDQHIHLSQPDAHTLIASWGPDV